MILFCGFLSPKALYSQRPLGSGFEGSLIHLDIPMMKYTGEGVPCGVQCFLDLVTRSLTTSR